MRGDVPGLLGADGGMRRWLWLSLGVIGAGVIGAVAAGAFAGLFKSGSPGGGVVHSGHVRMVRQR